MAQKIMIEIPENTSVTDLAHAVAAILIEDYGKHNYEAFLNTVAKDLSIDIKVATNE